MMGNMKYADNWQGNILKLTIWKAKKEKRNCCLSDYCIM